MISNHNNDSSKETKQDIVEYKPKELQNKDEGKVSDNANCTEKFLPEVVKPFFRPVYNKKQNKIVKFLNAIGSASKKRILHRDVKMQNK